MLNIYPVNSARLSIAGSSAVSAVIFSISPQVSYFQMVAPEGLRHRRSWLKVTSCSGLWRISGDYPPRNTGRALLTTYKGSPYGVASTHPLKGRQTSWE